MIGQQLLSLLYGDPSEQISRTLNPNPAPNPNPGAPLPVGPQGGAPGRANADSAGGGPSGAPSTGPQQPQPPMAPANATQSPPDLASLYVKLHQQDVAANQIDRGLALAASAFGTADQQRNMMNYARSTPFDDRTALIGKSLEAQDAQNKLQEHSRFMAGSAAMAKLLNIDQPTAAWAMNSPEVMKDMLAVHAANTTKTDLEKNIDAAANVYAQGGHSPEEVNAFKTKIYTLSTDPAAKEAATVKAKDAQEFKDTAIEDYTSVNNTLREQAGTVKSLLDDLPHTIAAIKNPVPTTGAGAYYNPFLSQKTKDQAVLIEKIKAALTGEGLKNVKNVRNVREFNILGQSLTAGLDMNNSPERIEQALRTVQDKLLDARATAELAAGHKLEGELVGHGNRDLLDSSNPYYAGATEEARPTVNSPEDIAKLAPGTPFIIPSGPHKGETGYAQ